VPKETESANGGSTPTTFNPIETKDGADDFMLICGDIGQIKSLFHPNMNL